MRKQIRKSIAAFTILIYVCVSSLMNVYAAVDTYTVQPGDSLWSIAKKYQVGISEIISANDQIKNPSMIYPGQKITIPLPDPVMSSMQEQVLALVNNERAKAGLSPVKLNWEVSRVAQYKSDEMKNKNYFSHTSPTYGSPFDMLKSFGVSYRTAGENIAKGQKTAQAVVTAWMNSEGHRKNILSSGFKEMGLGYSVGNGTTLWAQIFIG